MKTISYEMDKHGEAWEVWARYPNDVIALACVCVDSVWAARISLALEGVPVEKQEGYACGMTVKLDSDKVSKTYDELKAERISKLKKFLDRTKGAV